MCPNHSWQACIHKWTQGWCQVANILCRERVRSKRRGGSKQPTSDACLVEPCGMRPAWGELLALLHLKAAQSISAITTVCPPAFSSLSLSMLMLQAGVWCMMRLQGTWVAWRPHMSSLMPWCFVHWEKARFTAQPQNWLARFQGFPAPRNPVLLFGFFF